jgi:D-alanyl-D-alanine carboxypeptidase
MTIASRTQALQHLLDRCAAQPGAPALFLVRLHAPRLGLQWAASAGAPAHGSERSVLRIASITKSFVAAAVLRLVEQGRLALDDALPALLRPRSLALLRAGGYRCESITLRMLLEHTSGIGDFATPEVFAERVLKDPRHRWTREEQLALAMQQPREAAPGERYVYCDTNYILLGETLEVITELTMPQAVSTLLHLPDLGLRHTWFETLEAAPIDAPPMLAQHYASSTPVASFDASIDLYGAGGQLSTLHDLALFFRALLRGAVLKQPHTLAAMCTPSPQSLAAGGIPYGLGLELLRVDDAECWGHTGYWGVAAWHCPALDVTVATAVSDTARKDELRVLTRSLIARVSDDLA